MKAGNWALWHREVIASPDGTPYITRLRVVMTPLFSLYRHRIHTYDPDRALHDHPFPFASVITRGMYIEEVADLPRDGGPYADHRRTVVRKRGRAHVMTRRRAHRIVLVDNDTRTFVLVGPRRRGEDAWGFWAPGNTTHTPWRAYLDATRRGEAVTDHAAEGWKHRAEAAEERLALIDQEDDRG